MIYSFCSRYVFYNHCQPPVYLTYLGLPAQTWLVAEIIRKILQIRQITELLIGNQQILAQISFSDDEIKKTSKTRSYNLPAATK